jgi:hypothetical protein
LVIDQECDGRESVGTIGDRLRQAADDMASGIIPPGPVNVSWGGGDSRNPVRWALTQRLYTWSEYSRSHPQAVYEDGGGIVVYASGNDGNDDGVSGSAAGIYSIAAGAYNVAGETVYDWANRWNGLLVDYWADGKAPGGALGTSFAAPRVTGAIANLMRAGLTLWEAKTALYVDSIPISTNGHGDLALLDEAKARTRTEAVQIGESERVMAAYVVGCGRRPDQAGWTWWTDQARTNGLDETLGHMLRTARANGDWQQHKVPVARRVQCHYHLLLGREADDDGMKYWLRQIAHGHYGGVNVDPDSGFETAEGPQWYEIDWASFTRDFVSGISGKKALPAFADVLT